MTEEQSGEKSSQSVEQLLADAIEILNSYNKKFQLNITLPSEVNFFLNLSKVELENLTDVECGEGSYLLARYAAYLQKEINRESAKLTWAEHNLNIAIGILADKYGDQFTKFDIKKSMVIKNNPHARTLNKIIVNASLIKEEFHNMSEKIYYMSRTLGELQQTKRRK